VQCCNKQVAGRCCTAATIAINVVMQQPLHAGCLATTAPSFLQADIALLPFFERFQLALALFQDYDLAGVHGGAITHWMVSKGHVDLAGLVCERGVYLCYNVMRDHHRTTCVRMRSSSS
jgi:hypothetical protein